MIISKKGKYNMILKLYIKGNIKDLLLPSNEESLILESKIRNFMEKVLDD